MWIGYVNIFLDKILWVPNLENLLNFLWALYLQLSTLHYQAVIISY
jgi:hypothetical protein